MPKISQFTTQSLLSDTDLFTLVRSGTNLNIKYSDFKTDLGVTGSINQVGNPLGVPVLDKIGTANNIRNLEDGPGVSFSISAENGIIGRTNFTQGVAGTPIIKNLTNKQQLFRSLVAGSGINIASLGDDIQISAVDVQVSSKTVIVSQESDFPVASGGVITLKDGTDYFLINDISTSNRFLSTGSNTIRAAASQVIKLTYTGTGALYTGNSSNTRIQGITLSSPAGSLFDFSGPTVSGRFQLIESNVEDCDTIGTFNNMIIVRFSAIGWESIKTNGIVFSGVNFNVGFDTAVINMFGGTFIDMATSLINELSVSTQVFQPPTDPSVTFIAGVANSGNILTNGIGSFTGNRAVPLTTPLDTVSVEDNRFEFLSNSNIPDSISDGLIHTESNALETVITTIGVQEKVNAVFIDDEMARFTSDGLGRLTYTGDRDVRLPIDVVTTLLAVAGGDKQLNVCIAINGSVLTQTCVQVTVSSSKASAATTVWQHNFKTGDYVEVYISNETNTENIIATQVIVRIN